MPLVYLDTKQLRFVLALAAITVLAPVARANLPGGGTNGANVTLTDNNDGTITMANGIVSIHLSKSSGVIDVFNYTFKNSASTQTINMFGGGYSGGKFYWENSSDLGPNFTYAVVANPTANGGNYAEVVLTASGSANVSNIVMEAHFS
ncbi:MAG: hypothetical protein EPO07_00830, partial [Verrucomicrobia bacterium]